MSKQKSLEEGRIAANRVCSGQNLFYIDVYRKECLAVAKLGVSDYYRAYYLRICEIILERAEKGEGFL